MEPPKKSYVEEHAQEAAERYGISLTTLTPRQARTILTAFTREYNTLGPFPICPSDSQPSKAAMNAFCGKLKAQGNAGLAQLIKTLSQNARTEDGTTPEAPLDPEIAEPVIGKEALALWMQTTSAAAGNDKHKMVRIAGVLLFKAIIDTMKPELAARVTTSQDKETER